jgi:hypothetical protein
MLGEQAIPGETVIHLLRLDYPGQVRRKPRRFNGSGEADLRGFSQQPGGIAVFSPSRQTTSVDTLHLANRRVFAGSVVNRSHG